MKKNYTKPEIEMVEYKTNDVIMISGDLAGLDNDVEWINTWTGSGAGLSGMLN